MGSAPRIPSSEAPTTRFAALALNPVEQVEGDDAGDDDGYDPHDAPQRRGGDAHDRVGLLLP